MRKKMRCIRNSFECKFPWLISADHTLPKRFILIANRTAYVREKAARRLPIKGAAACELRQRTQCSNEPWSQINQTRRDSPCVVRALLQKMASCLASKKPASLIRGSGCRSQHFLKFAVLHTLRLIRKSSPFCYLAVCTCEPAAVTGPRTTLSAHLWPHASWEYP